MRRVGGFGSVAHRAMVVAQRQSSAVGPKVFGSLPARHLAHAVTKTEDTDITKLRNIGISAHVDSGKTTITERVLFYTGRIRKIHEVGGKDGVGAKMDSMDLEREKGITIQSAATHTRWKDFQINIIDTPGHVDFTIEVERALRVLDGAVLLVCAVGGVQSQTSTVDRQMKRYGTPRIVFINKLDRMNANPDKCIQQLRDKLHLNVAATQIPIGLEKDHEGVVDVITMKALRFVGDHGDTVVEEEVPVDLVEKAQETRALLIERVAEVDDELGELFIGGEEPTIEQLQDAIRRATIANTFAPALMGSAYKDKGVQPLLDAVLRYLPHPQEKETTALELHKGGEENEIVLSNDKEAPLVALAFKLEDGKYGQLTYMRVYQGVLRRGGQLYHVATGKKTKCPRVVRMHADDMEDVDEVRAGEICAIFGIECSSGDTFTGGAEISMTSMHVPDAVMSLAIKPKDRNAQHQFSKALNRFTKEDPTFRLSYDPETSETVISGMGELHLEIYVERINREYGVECITGAPKVNYFETITRPVEVDYTHKKQTGGQGQFAKIIGTIEPLHSDKDYSTEYIFENELIGTNIPSNFVPAIDAGFQEGCDQGALAGQKVVGIRCTVKDGASHAVDSSDLAFRLCARAVLRIAQEKGASIMLEPVMKVEVTIPEEYQGTVVGELNRRKGIMQGSDTMMGVATIQAEVPLANMFGYSTELRSNTQGQGEFTMEYCRHAPVPPNTVEELKKQYREERAAGNK